jgi:hypothetical protein
MLPHLFILFGALVANEDDRGQVIEGWVQNGSRGNVPAVGREVILRAERESEWIPVAKCVTDANGRFAFIDVPSEPDLVFLPGANHEGVHYPGPRLQMSSAASLPQVRLTVYDTVSFPSPLIAERHEIEIRSTSNSMEISEIQVINNPSNATYVGEKSNATSVETLSIGIPDGFERVTFSSEFHGRRFRIAENRILTDIPWPPGKRELKYTYQLPWTRSGRLSFDRSLDLPCSLVRLRVRGRSADQLSCNLPVAAQNHEETVFESVDTLPSGHHVQLALPGPPYQWPLSARYVALIVLGGLIVVTAAVLWQRRKKAVSRPMQTTALQTLFEQEGKVAA